MGGRRLLAAAALACCAADLPEAAHEGPVDLALRLDAVSHPLPAQAPSVVVHAPAGVPRTGAPVVVYLHGWQGCAAAIAGSGPVSCLPGAPSRSGWGIAERFDASQVLGLLVVPQLAFDAQSSSAGALSDAAFALRWWSELGATLRERAGLGATGPVMAVAHSGGYRALQALLAAGLEDLDTAVFLDGLYGGADQVAGWVTAAPGRRVVSVYTAHPTTTAQSLHLAQLAAARLGAEAVAVDPPDLAAAVRDHAVVVARTEVAHGAVPAATLADLVRALAD